MRAIGIILAGGHNHRMRELSQKRAISAMPVAGSYRSIDFALSNMSNSHIQRVAVLTQYNARSLNEHLSSSKWWDFGRKQGGLYVFTPVVTADNSNWYRGTADAIYQNINFLDSYDPDYVLILSGDHIYKMDYDKMLNHHKACEADVTIAVRPVEWKEASRFGIMSTDESGRITEFEEKPAEPKSNLASMGIYIFNWKLLRKMLIADMDNEDSDHDFGKDIIPTLLNDGKRLFAYEFSDYWKDVGTVDSLWEANMDLLSDNNELDLNDKNWKIYTEDVATIPHFVGPNGKINNAYINQGCLIDGTVNNSVLFTNVKIEKGAEVNGAVLLPNVEVGEGAVINRAIIAEGVKIAAGAVVGDANSEDIALISKNVK